MSIAGRRGERRGRSVPPQSGRCCRRPFALTARRWAITLYAGRPHPWQQFHAALVSALTGQLAVSAADARSVASWQRAADTRTGIGQAEGIAMERFGIDADRAFDELRWVSQTTHRQLLAVAEDVVRTRRYPRLRRPSR